MSRLRDSHVRDNDDNNGIMALIHSQRSPTYMEEGCRLGGEAMAERDWRLREKRFF